MISVLVDGLGFLAVIPVVVCGAPILLEVIKDTLKKEIAAEALVVMALIGCLILEEYVAAAEIAIIMSIGELLEVIVTNQARSGMDALGKLKVDKANLVVGNEVVQTSVGDIKVGDRIRIFPGETIPLDGTVILGDSSVDKSIITGESMPADVSIGDGVFAGTTNLYGSIDVEVAKVDSESTIARMSRLMENADVGKSRIVNAADRWAKWILLGAIVITAITYLLTEDIYRALTIMVVFCPCAFVLATPTGIMAAAGNMARNGILLRDTSAIEGMARVDSVLFDKTGTLTTGKISSLGFTAVNTELDGKRIEQMVSAIETRSEHPLGKAIASNHTPIGNVKDFRNIPGQGVTGIVDGYAIAAGNRLLMESECPAGLESVLEAVEDCSCTTVLVGIDGTTVGYIGLEDTVKEESPAAIEDLCHLGVRTVMLTGDNQKVGGHVAQTLGMDNIVWECLPETKLKTVTYFEEKGHACMIGDGMNDAPSLKRATVGISMGSIGNDLTVGSSDIVFMNDDIGKVPGLVRLCRRSVKTIYIGLALAMTINIIGVIFGMIGTIGPIEGAIIHNMGSFIVILLAASLLWANTWKPEAPRPLCEHCRTKRDHPSWMPAQNE
ncbi:MAG: cadmium-translocating P-type ATPase [Thermoplasmata archaeon]|nr:cadmium-translocating P-type ATPase [Thermoplasmata archaeon]